MMMQMENLANVQSTPRERLSVDIAGALMFGATRLGETRYVSIENCTYNEVREEVLMSTDLGRLKKVSLPVLAHVVHSSSILPPTLRPDSNSGPGCGA
jgi:hypothetical protein